MDRKYVLGSLVALVLSNLVNFIPILQPPVLSIFHLVLKVCSSQVS
jgi:hypothetical protein